MTEAQVTAMIAAARGCIGTPFHHQGRLPGTGLDCIGLVIVALRAAGMTVNDRQDYSRRPDGASLAEALAAHGASVVADIVAGDALLFAFDGAPQHVALAASPDRIIHAYAPAGKVIETFLSAPWRRRLIASYRFGG
ncbi:MAG: NlpC/P60 family protein [Alphaproteobacteria bacterium]